MSRRGCKPNFKVVRNDKTGECLSHPMTETFIYQLKGDGYTDLAEVAEESDAQLLAECHNMNWDVDYIAYLQQYMTVHKNLITDSGEKLDIENIEKMVEEVRTTQERPEMFQCIGCCGSLKHNQKCDACFEHQHRIWNTCATVTILREHVDSVLSQE